MVFHHIMCSTADVCAATLTTCCDSCITSISDSSHTHHTPHWGQVCTEVIDTKYPSISDPLLTPHWAQVCNEVIDTSGGVSWEDIAGLATAKALVNEVVVWPMLNPSIFTVRIRMDNAHECMCMDVWDMCTHRQFL